MQAVFGVKSCNWGGCEGVLVNCASEPPFPILLFIQGNQQTYLSKNKKEKKKKKNERLFPVFPELYSGEVKSRLRKLINHLLGCSDY